MPRARREAAERAGKGHRAGAGLEGARLVVAFVASAEAEQVHLVVARDALAGIVEYQAGAADAALIAAGHGRGAADEPEAMLARGARQEVLDRAAAIGLAQFHFVGLVPADEVEVLGQRDEPRASGGGGGNEAAGGLEVRADLRPRDHLQRGDARLRQGVEASFGTGAGVSFTTFGSAQLPVTSNS